MADPIVTISDASVVEGDWSGDANYLTFQVILSEAASTNVSFKWYSRMGTVSNYDFSSEVYPAGTVTIAAGSTTGLVELRIAGGTGIELDESVVIELYNLTGAQFEGGAERISATGIILNDDGSTQSRVLLVSDAELVEGDAGTQQMVFHVQLSRAAATDLTFDYQSIDGSATAGADYTATSGSLTFAAGQTEATVIVDVTGDTLIESTELFSLQLTPQSTAAASLATGDAAVVGTGMIIEDDGASDALPVLSILDVRNVEGDWGGDANYLTFQVILSEAASTNVSFKWYSRMGTVSNYDFSSEVYPAGTVTIAAGSTTGFVELRIAGDTGIELDESVVIELYNLTGAQFEGGAERISATGIILNDDGSTQSRVLLVSDAELVEGDAGTQQMLFHVQLSRAAATDLTFDYQSIDGSATAGADYTATSGSLTFAAGQTEAVVVVDVTGDTLIESSENFFLQLTPQTASAASLATGEAAVAGTGLIIADDGASNALPVLSILDVRNVEGDWSGDANYLTFQVILSEAASTNVSFKWYSRMGTVSNYDFSSEVYPAGTVTIAAGSTTGFVELRIAGGTGIELDESVVIELYNLTGAQFEGGAERITTTGIILNDDGTAESRVLLASDAELVEGDAGTQQMVFHVQLSRAAATDLTFDYQSIDGSATAGADYTATSGSLTFAAGQTEAVVVVDVTGDTLIESSENFFLQLTPQTASAASLATGEAAVAGTGLIIADDGASNALPVLSILDVRNVEGDWSGDANYLTFQVILSEAASTNVSFKWYSRMGTVSNYDFSSEVYPAGTVTIAAGSTTGFVELRIAGGTGIELDESVVIELYNLTGAQFEGGAERITTTGIILNDDGTAESRVLLVSDAELVEGDAGTQQMVFHVQLSRAAATDLTFDYQSIDGSATAGADYTATSGSLTFAAGQTEATVIVDVTGDTLIESTELFSLQLTPQSTAAASLATGEAAVAGTGLIIADDGASNALPVLSILDVRNIEGDWSGDANYLTFQVLLDKPASSNVTVNWATQAGTATGVDTSSGGFPSGTLTIAAGDTTGLINIRIAGDGTAEPDESLYLNLTGISGAQFAGGLDQLTTTGIILNDDGTDASRALFIQDAAIVEGDEGIRQMAFRVQLSRPADTDLSFDYQTVDGSATAGSDYTATAGTITFLAGQTDATVFVDIFGDYHLEADETFTLSFAPSADVANGASGIEATGTIISDDLQNPPNANADSYTIEAGASLTPDATTGVLANDTDIEGDTVTAALSNGPSHGSLTLYADGAFTYTPDNGYTGADSFTYRAYDGIGYSAPTTVSITVDAAPPAFTGGLTLPDSLAPGEEGTGTFTYINNASVDQAGILVYVTSTAGLLVDPLTGSYADSLFLLGLGDGIGDIAPGETGALDFLTRMANYPGYSETVSVSIADPLDTIDWASQADALKPDFVSEAVWTQIYSNFQASVGTTAGTLIEELAENAHFLADLGATSDSAATALAFELEQAGDFGSIVERGTPGSMGLGWAFIGDIRLELDADGNAALRGSTDFGALFSLDAGGAAYYTVSSSVGQSVSLTGDVLGGAPANRPTFTHNIDGSYSVGGNFDGTLSQTDTGYQLTSTSGTTLVFDSVGKLERAIAPNGQQSIASYGADGLINGFTGPNSASLTIVREANGNPTALTDADGFTTTLGYSADGATLISATTQGGSASLSYDANGNLNGVTPSGGPSTGFSYDSAGHLVNVDVANGSETLAVSYDSLGGYTLTNGAGASASVDLAPGGTIAAMTDGTGNTAELVFDVTGTLVGAQLADGSTVGFSFDDQGRLTTLTDANGATFAYTYEGDATRPASFTDANGSTRSFSYDANGQLTQATWVDGTRLQFNYDADGNLVSYTNRSGQTADYTYDERGNLLSESDGTAGAVDYTYDTNGRLIAAVNDDGTTSIAYDVEGHVALIEYPNGRSLAYTYDEAGRRTSMIDQDGHAQRYTYDAAGRLASLADENGTLVDYGYDAAGNLILEENGNGTVTTYAYDSAGRLTDILNLAPDGSENSHYRYTYDEAGNRVTQDTADGLWTYGYDAAGQLTSAYFESARVDIADKSLEYHYDDAGNRTSVIEDGVETVYTSNALNQYVSVGNASYVYDDNGNMVAKTDASGTWVYAYDLENRLTAVAAPDGSTSQYEYDVFGNRTAVIENGVRTDFLVDPFGLGKITSEYADDGSFVASYLNGIGLVARHSSDGSTRYFDMDSVASVVSVTNESGTIYNSYIYSPFGIDLFEKESIANAFQFNGGLGVSSAIDDLTYMRSRMYSAALGRFISEDPIWVGDASSNQYSFADNSPLSWADPSGQTIVAAGIYVMGLTYEATLFSQFTVAYALNYDNKYMQEALVDEFFGAEGELGYGSLVGLVPWGKGIQYASKAAKWVSIAGKFGDDVAFHINEFTSAFKMSADGLEIIKSLETLKTITHELLFGPDEEVDFATVLAQMKIEARIARSDGDPHLVTFDGLAYDFQATGEFVLARSDGLEVQARQEPWGNRTDVSLNTAAAIRVGDSKIGLYIGQTNPLNINGEFVAITDGETVYVDGGSAYRNGNLYVITNENGDGLWARVYSNHLNLRVFINDSRDGSVVGLLGNNDGDTTNDIALADGTVLEGRVPATQLYGDYADGWRVTDETTLFVYGDGESTASYTDQNFPAGIVTLDDLDPDVRAAAEQAARDAGYTEGTVAFDNAVLDIALTGDPEFLAGAADLPTDTEEPVVLVVQQAPIVTGESASTQEDTPVTIDVLANDSDPEGDPLQVIAASDANGGTVLINAIGQLDFTPAPNFNGVTELSYTVSDGAGNEVLGTVSVTVEAVNDAPSPTDDEYTTASGQALVVNPTSGLLANDGDVDGDSLTVVSVDAPAHGTLDVLPDGSFTYTPEPGFSGVETLNYQVSDGTETVDAVLSITVVGTVAVEAGANASLDEGDTLTRTLAFSDGEDNGTAGWDYTIDYGDGSTDSGHTTTQSVDLDHTYADGDASHTVSVTVTDETGESATDSFTVDVANVAPTASVSGADSVDEGSVYALSVGALVDPGTDTVASYSIDWGDGSTDTLTPAEWAAAAGSFAHIYADGDATSTISVSVTDEDGTFVLGTKDVTVNNVAPSATLGGASSLNEGDTFSLAISGSDPAGSADTLSYSIDWGDGSAAQLLTAAELAGLGGSVDHVFADDEDGPVNATDRTITVTVADEDGGSSDSTHTVTVNNVAPTIAVSGAASIVLGSTYTLALGAVTDPGTDTVASYTIDWGDGNSETVGSAGDVTHDYVGTGSYNISVSLTDEDGTHTDAGSASVEVTAPSATLSLEAGADANLNEGDTFTRTIAFSDGEDNGAAGWSYSIDYGDGSAPETGTTLVKSIDLNHAYADGDATHTVTVTLTDEAGETASDSFTVNVANVVPSATVSGADSVDEGSSYSLAVGALSDPGADTAISYSIDWGDGSTDTLTPAEWAAAAGSFAHIYADGDATSTISVSVTDEDGTFVLGTKDVTVNNVAPSATLGGASSLNEGDTFSLAISGSDPAGSADTLSYSIDWGDGSAAQLLTAAELAGLGGSVDHVFADDEDGPVNATDRTITVTVADEDGGSSDSTHTVTVNNVAPTIAVSGAASIVLGSTYMLALGAVTDPGTDTVTSYIIDWGDGNSEIVGGAGDVTHDYVGTGSYSISVSLTDEDGTHTDAGSASVEVTAPSATLSLEAGADANLNEGDTFTRTIAFSDGEDNGAAGWSYSIDYGDGSAPETGTTLVKSIDLNHAYADGDATHTVTVTLTDEAGETASDSFTVNVANVVPSATVSGADSVDEGSSYSLAVGALSDPGADTAISYSIDWGDGSTDTLTPAEWAAAAGSFAHIYADGDATSTISVSVTDEDGTFVLGTKDVTVNNVAPSATLGGASSLNEGDTFSLAISGSDPAGSADTLSYSIDWGDGSAVQMLTAAELAGLGGSVDHVFADDDNGPVNATDRTITVTVADEDGGSSDSTHTVTVNNVAPSVALNGAGSAETGSPYTLTLGAITDPGTDTVSQYIIDWGDGSTSPVASGGDYNHTYASAGNYTINVALVDEDGTTPNAGQLAVSVAATAEPELVRIGDAPTRVTSANPTAIEDAWIHGNHLGAVVHKADATDTGEAWTDVSFGRGSPTTLAGADHFGGDLGVSGQSMATSSVRQEIDGREALRFELDQGADKVTVDLSRFYLNDDGTVLAESGRLQLFDAAGNVVGETSFVADAGNGTHTVSLSSTTEFIAVELSAGAYDGADFMFGGYAQSNGDFGSHAYADASGALHGSDFLVDWIEFEFPPIGVASGDPLGTP